jgi:hypothetical protein
MVAFDYDLDAALLVLVKDLGSLVSLLFKTDALITFTNDQTSDSVEEGASEEDGRDDLDGKHGEEDDDDVAQVG